jgi:hypothetical protein
LPEFGENHSKIVSEPLEKRRRTDDKADYIAILKRGQLKRQLCIFKSFPHIQAVEIDHPIRATLAP